MSDLKVGDMVMLLSANNDAAAKFIGKAGVVLDLDYSGPTLYEYVEHLIKWEASCGQLIASPRYHLLKISPPPNLDETKHDEELTA